MIDVRVTGEDLEIVLTGADCWPYLLRRRWSTLVPLEHVRQARADAPRPTGLKRHVNDVASERGRDKGSLIWARFRAPTLRIDLEGGPYRRIILSVADPERAAEDIRSAMPASPR